VIKKHFGGFYVKFDKREELAEYMEKTRTRIFCGIVKMRYRISLKAGVDDYIPGTRQQGKGPLLIWLIPCCLVLWCGFVGRY
jgi:viroplasmin and RNaseH domain-containing protein